MRQPAWQFLIDRGGTFTDIVAIAPDGTLDSLKLLSDNPARYSDAALAGIEHYLDRASASARDAPFSIRMGTTVGTNALLERQGEPTVLVTTAGLRDAIRIGTQQRPEIFALDIRLPEMLYSEVIEAHERLAADGDVVTPLDEDRITADLEAVREAGFDSVAIVLLHGYAYPRHERRIAKIAEGIGFGQISVSHRISPLMKIVPRGDTTLVDAYLTPVLRRYVDTLSNGLGNHRGDAALLFMQSHGGLIESRQFRGKDCVLSGPAGGVVGMASSAAAAGYTRVIGFDMGGTSTDVSLFDERFERTAAAVIAGVRIAAPMMRIHTVAAGGGSILKFRSGRPQVGPESAGAFPGPACYRNGGPLTVTDANVFLGRIQPGFFPATFGPNSDQPIDAARPAREFAALAERIAGQRVPSGKRSVAGAGSANGESGVAAEGDVVREGGERITPEALAAGFLRIAVERMSNAIKQISIQRGHDVTGFALSCFGGAAGQHACQVADALGIDTVLIHPLAGVLSAYGMGVADLRTVRQRAVEAVFDAASLGQITELWATLGEDAKAEIAAQRVPTERIELESRLFLKIQGSDTALPVAWRPGTPAGETLAAFRRSHERHFGFIIDEETVVVESIEVEAVGVTPRPPEAELSAKPAATETAATPEPPEAELSARPAATETAATPKPPEVELSTDPAATKPVARARVWMADAWTEAPVYERTALGAGATIAGPAIIVEANATTVVEPDWRAEVDSRGYLVLGRATPRQLRERVARECDPIMLEVFNNLFMHIAEQMGVVLQNTAHSVNIKERVDFSCAVFDGAGELIANAPHLPVHLGSMGDSVRTVLEANSADMRPGDAWMLNAPYNGGTHLPDITVVTPVFDEAGTALRFVVANRAHHADVGGITPGSMPATSRSIEEEGVVLDNVRIVRDGRFDEATVRAAFADTAWPARNPDRNVADLKAQIAANTRGIAELATMVERFGAGVVHAYMAHIKRNAETCVRDAIAALRDGRRSLELDSGERIVVTVTIDHERREALIDFTDTSAASPGNFNAPASVARAAVLYVFRTLVAEAIPLNEGCLKPLTIRLPDRSLVNPRHPAAVVAGNVETSQCITDALLGALGVAAAAQGTMNNLTFGDDRYQYYETICGGAGAGPGFAGASAVHTHMTNSRLTDPEVLEWRFPVRVRRFEIRAGSGGDGEHRGGDGVIREIESLRAMRGAILSNRRRVAPFGLAGGGDGAPGKNTVVRASGSVEPLAAAAEFELEPGDCIVIETPGGGGFGTPGG